MSSGGNVWSGKIFFSFLLIASFCLGAVDRDVSECEEMVLSLVGNPRWAPACRAVKRALYGAKKNIGLAFRHKRWAEASRAFEAAGVLLENSPDYPVASRLYKFCRGEERRLIAERGLRRVGKVLWAIGGAAALTYMTLKGKKWLQEKAKPSRSASHELVLSGDDEMWRDMRRQIEENRQRALQRLPEVERQLAEARAGQAQRTRQSGSEVIPVVVHAPVAAGGPQRLQRREWTDLNQFYSDAQALGLPEHIVDFTNHILMYRNLVRIELEPDSEGLQALYRSLGADDYFYSVNVFTQDGWVSRSGVSHSRLNGPDAFAGAELVIGGEVSRSYRGAESDAEGPLTAFDPASDSLTVQDNFGLLACYARQQDFTKNFDDKAALVRGVEILEAEETAGQWKNWRLAVEDDGGSLRQFRVNMQVTGGKILFRGPPVRDEEALFRQQPTHNSSDDERAAFEAKVAQMRENAGEEDCIVCMEKFEPGQMVACWDCEAGHVVHFNDALKWGIGRGCPKCRSGAGQEAFYTRLPERS